MICLDCMQTITIFMKLNSFFFHAYSSFLIVLFSKLLSNTKHKTSYVEDIFYILTLKFIPGHNKKNLNSIINNI